MEALALIGISFVGTVFWLVSPEVSAVVYGSTLGWHPLAVGVTVAVGQVPAYGLLYWGGEELAARWRWLDRTVQRTRHRLGAHLARSYLLLTALAALTGLPPCVALCALGSAFGIRARTLLPVVAAGRFLRFSILAGGGGMLPPLPWLP